MPPLESPASASKATPITPGVSIAPVDRDSLAALLKPAMKADWDIVPTTANITATGSMVQYVLGPATKLAKASPTDPLDDYYLLTIRVGGSVTTLMSGHVEGFEGPKPVAVEGLTKPLGDAALRTPWSVFWARGESVFVEILHCVNKVPSGTSSKTSLFTSTGRSR